MGLLHGPAPVPPGRRPGDSKGGSQRISC
jgi:hypothetical protein